MPWVKIDDRFWSNSKVRAAGESAAVYVRCLTWCSNDLTDGVIPENDIVFVCAGIRNVTKHADHLVSIGMFERVGDTYVIPDYLDFQPSRAEVLAKRQADRDRKNRGRQSQADARTGGNPTGGPEESSGNPAGIQTDSSGPVPSRPVPNEEHTSAPADAGPDTPPVDPIDQELCDYLAGQIERVHGRRPKQPASWAVDMRRLRTLGSTEWADPEPIDPDKIRRLIDWAMADDFWSKNVRSPGKLRQQWERLRLSANSSLAAGRAAEGIVPLGSPTEVAHQMRRDYLDAQQTREMLDAEPDEPPADRSTVLSILRQTREGGAA